MRDFAARLFIKPCGLLSAIFVACLLMPPAAYASESGRQPEGPQDAHEVETFMDDFFKREDIKKTLAGAVVTVVQGDKRLLAKGYGFSDKKRREPVDPDKTLFRLASISKTFTATAVMQLAEENKIDLDSDIGMYLKAMTIPNRTGGPLTLKHLMTHSSGFDRTEADTDEGDPQEVYPLETFIKDNIPTVVRKPGEAFRYDNYAFDLMGYIVQNVAGKPFENAVEDRIFKPLGMRNSYFALTPDIEKRLATPYDGEGKPLPQYATLPNNSPDGGLISTGSDMARFMIAELNNGQEGRTSILKKESLQEMQRLGFSIHPDIPGVGYGFESSYPDLASGEYVIDKSGASSGFQSHFWLLPDRKTGLFIALNSVQNARTLQRELFRSFMDHYFPRSHQAESLEPAIRQSKEQLARLEGNYRDLRIPMWHYSISAEDGGITVTDAYGVHRLTPLKELLFVDGEGRKAAFKENERGDIVYFSYNKADSWSEKLPEAKRFIDVPEDHHYAKFIEYVQQQGMLAKEDNQRFFPDQPITRAQFIGQLMALSGLPLSESPAAFRDSADSPYAAEIQTALEMGLVNGTKERRFEPDRFITRQEAAVIMSRALLLQFGSAGAAAQTAELMSGTDPWALAGVETVVARGYFGPEVARNENEKVDYRPKQPMLRQEAAAMFYHFP